MRSPLLVSLRPHQWVKNLFVLAPLLFSLRLDEPRAVALTALAFAVFCAAASAVYLINDLTDRQQDRLHPLKRHRPLAAGTLSARTAGITAAALSLLALGGAWWLGPRLAAYLVAYLLLNVLYSLWLKRIVILDVMSVALGYILRIGAGAAVLAVEVSTWLLLCTTFLALFLIFSKRRHELLLLPESAASQRRVLAHYNPAFLDQMINVVTASTLISYALYAVAPQTIDKFGSRNLLYTLPFVLYGIFRYLYLTYQAENDYNPTEAVLRDRPSIVNVVLWIIAVLAALYG